MNKISLVCFVACFILLLYLLCHKTTTDYKLNELENKIKKLQAKSLDRPTPVNAIKNFNEAEDSLSNEKHLQAEQISLDMQNDQIQSMINEAVQRYLQKEADKKKAQGIYNSVFLVAEILRLNDSQKEKFWPIMVEFYEEFQRLRDGLKTCDKTSRDAYKWQLEQLRTALMQKLGQILSNEQMEQLQIHLPE